MKQLNGVFFLSFYNASPHYGRKITLKVLNRTLLLPSHTVLSGHERHLIGTSLCIKYLLPKIVYLCFYYDIAVTET